MNGKPIDVYFEGQRYRLPDLCKAKNVSYNVIKDRLKRGWSVYDAINIPKIKRSQTEEEKRAVKRNYYLNHRDEYIERSRKQSEVERRTLWEKRVDDAVEEYQVCMRRYYTKEFRIFQMKSLNRFYKEAISGILQVA